MNKYLENLKYVVRHKFYVGIECVKMGMFWHALTHDLSKFLPSEFIPYANNFHSGPWKKHRKINRRAMAEAWLHHKNRNKHHWDYWVNSNGKAIPMPEKYVKQLIVDWRGMGRQKGFDSAISYYAKTKYRMVVHKETTKLIHKYLFDFVEKIK